MKKWILINSIKLIKKTFPNYSQIKLEQIKYGLEAIYLTLTKVIIIFYGSYILKTTNETIILLTFFGIIRSSGFGLHASKSWICLTGSLIFFVFVPALLKGIIIPTSIMLTMSFICIVLFIKYAPADTEKRPLVNNNHRLYLKLITILIGLIYFILIYSIDNMSLKIVILISTLLESVLILPITYKIFGSKYNNYKYWNKNKEVQ